MPGRFTNDLPFDGSRIWPPPTRVRLWIVDFVAAVGLVIFIGSAWLLTALVLIALPD